MKHNEIKTPQWIDSIIDTLAPAHFAEEIRGDLYECFRMDLEEKGIRTARRKYVWRGLGFVFKRFFWKKTPFITSNSLTMILNYFKMAKRSLLASKGTSFINIIGLVTGIASALTVIAVIRYETSFDTFHSKADRIYRVVRISGEDMSEFRSGISFPVHRAMRDEIAGLNDIAAMEYFGGAYVDVLDTKGNSERKFREEFGFALVEPSFFKVFDFAQTNFKWLAGNKEKAFDEPFNTVLTSSMAKKYFGNEDPIGRTIKIQQKFDCKVTGVIEDFPPNTDFPFTVLLSYASVPTLASKGVYDDWFSVNDSHHVYLRLPEHMSKEEMEKQIAKIHAAHTPKELHESRHYLLQSLSELHHDARFSNYSRRTISRETILGLSIVMLFLLLTACINYINLATAQSTLRSKEIGVRKVMGSNQRHVMLQFLTETFVIVSLSAFAALLVADAILITFQSLLNVTFTQHVFTDTTLLLFLLIIVASVTLFAGFYPALIISRFNPVTALKNNLNLQKPSAFSMRKVLVVFQFTITQILVVGTFIVMSQIQYFSHVNMGFNREGIISTRVHSRNLNTLETLRNKLLANPDVADVSYSYTLPSGVKRNRSYADIGRTDANEMKDYLVYEFVSIDPSYLGLYDIKLLAGRNLMMSDSIGNILVNKTLLKNLQLGTPNEAIGKELKRSDGERSTIVGVVDDYYGNSLKEQADNIVMLIQRTEYATLSIKLNVKESESLQSVVDGVGQIWLETFPEYIFNYTFLDENIKAFYVQEEKYARLFQMFSIVFLLIGLLGLYGLISFLANRKSKEVAVRKVFGATLMSIMILFSKDYIKLIALSFILSVPVAYYLLNDWLSHFANHIELQWWLFILPGLGVLLVTMLIVGMKMLNTARINPVDKLKYE
ncbi:MAG: ABC transporter permease [Chryseolinea sp.]